MKMEEYLSVSQLSSQLKSLFDNEVFYNVTVVGEIYSIAQSRSIFTYIDLGDEDGDQTRGPILKCAFRSFDIKAKEDFKKGDIVKVRGKLSYYPHGSSLTLWLTGIELHKDSLGKNLLKKRKILEKLDKLGYLDEKRKIPVPELVNNVGIVTANFSAAYNDILVALKSRFPVSTVLYPCQVQGENAAKSIIRALTAAIDDKVDVIILGRGGGSNSDLSAFDDEELAFKIAESKVPIITCIGHSIDETIADRVASKVCITPTDAGNSINPSLAEVKDSLSSKKRMLIDLITAVLRDYENALSFKKKIFLSLSSDKRIELLKNTLEKKMNLFVSLFKDAIIRQKEMLKNKKDHLNYNINNLVGVYKTRLTEKNLLLEKNSKQDIATKGYIKVFIDDKIIKSSDDLKTGDEVSLSFFDGKKDAIIK